MNFKKIINQINPSSKGYETITLENLQSALQTSKGAKIVSLTTITEPDLIGSPGDYSIVKISYINCIINFDYATAVNNQRIREGKEPDFKAKPRKWGTRLTDSPFVSHVLKDTGEHKLYLEVKLEEAIRHQYYSPSNKIMIDDETVKPFLNRKKDSTKDLQDVKKEIILRDYFVGNIAAIAIDGHGYFIKENIID